MGAHAPWEGFCEGAHANQASRGGWQTSVGFPILNSLAKAQQLLGLDSLTIIYPGDRDYPLAEGIHAKSLQSLMDEANRGGFVV